MFVGAKGLYQKIVLPSDRVRSIFHDEPIIIPTLPPVDIVKIVNTRYEILRKGPDYFKPVDDEAIKFLSMSYNGRVRDIMNTITNLMFQIPEGMANTLCLKDVKVKLLSIEEKKLLTTGLTKTDIDILKIMLELEVFNNTKLVEKTTMTKQHINKFIKKFLEFDIIEHFEKAGRVSNYHIHPRLSLLLKLVKDTT